MTVLIVAVTAPPMEARPLQPEEPGDVAVNCRVG
jgi:hypothetical protein